MKPAVLRPQALRDQQGEVWYYRKEGGTRLAVKVAKATNEALDQVELEPGMGSPSLGKLLGIPGLRTWRVGRFPLLWWYFERKQGQVLSFASLAWTPRPCRVRFASSPMALSTMHKAVARSCLSPPRDLSTALRA